MTSQAEIIGEIVGERQRQEELREAGKFLWTCADPTVSNARRLAVLAEEFGEASREVVEEIIASDKGMRELNDAAGRAHDEDAKAARERLRKELVQIASVCVAWLESFAD